MKINIKLELIKLIEYIFYKLDIVEIKAKYAKDKLGSTYKCICISSIYIIVPNSEVDHKLNQDHKLSYLTYETAYQKNSRTRTGIGLNKVPNGASELLAWCDAFNKICNKV